MAAVLFDTLQLAGELREAGFSEDQAAGTAKALARSFSSEVALRSDLDVLKTELRSDTAALRSEIRGEFGSIRSEIGSVRSEFPTIRSEFATIRSEMATMKADLRGEIAALRASTANWIITAVMVNTVAMLGIAATLYGLLRSSLGAH